MLNEKSLNGHAVVIGAGVMGAGIAALLSNVGWRVSLLDRVPTDAGADPKARSRIAQEGLDRVVKSRPPQFALPEYAAAVRVGNIEDHLAWLRDADWVVEAVAEEMGVKKTLMAAITKNVGPETVVSSNTSGLGLAEMTAECPASLRARFLGTHFFNPPRYMKPLELIPTPDTDPAVYEGFAGFAERVLGKRVVPAKDTPGFISTRLGIYALAKTLEIAVTRGLTVEEVDYLTGPLIGHPKSGAFRLADVIGLDIVAAICDNQTAALPNDRYQRSLRLPEAMRKLIAEGRIGAKAGAGFYKREKSGEIISLDFATLDYRPRQEPKPFSSEVEKLPLDQRLRKLWALSPEHDGGFLQEMFRATVGFMADVAPEVADRIVEVDDALIGGYGWELGPFQTLDALDSLHAVEWPDGEPTLVARLRESGLDRFYTNENGNHFYFDFQNKRMTPLARPADVIVLKDLKKAGRVVEETDHGTLTDLGDGVLSVTWNTKMNVLDPDRVAFLNGARIRAERDFAALVVGGTGEHFSAGFNLNLFAERIEARDWSTVESMLKAFQDTLIGFKYASVPVVCAVYGYTLGGGCEIMLHGAETQAAFESAIGLPEANVGLIPAGGGTTQMFLRAMAEVPPGNILERTDPFPFIRPVWDTLRLGRFSGSANEARAMGFLQTYDAITFHPDRLLHDAKMHALALAADRRPPVPPTVSVLGEEMLARFRWELHLLRRADQISEHDARVADRLAYIFSGGALVHAAEVSESYLLDLEREAFLSLAGTPETLARIRHMLETGKPLKN